ncbi:hypothetical protein JCM6882_009221 [Rhodosporidiobolus microsporus]
MLVARARLSRLPAPPHPRPFSLFSRPAPPPAPASPPPPSPSGPEHHDLVIVGGGPAGLTLAAALAASEPIAQTHRITLLEGASLKSTRDWEPREGRDWSNRVSSITADNVRFLTDAGIWQHLDLTRVRPIEEMQVWDGLSGARIEFEAPFAPSSSSPSPLPSSSSSPSSPSPAPGTEWDTAFASALRPHRLPMSTLLENLNLQRAALRRIEQLKRERGARVEVVEGKRVGAIEEDEGGWPVVRLEGEEGREFRARLLIGADGAASPVKTYSGIDTFGWQYGRHGVVATLEVDAPLPGREGEGMNTAWQRFLPEGPVAFLPLSDTHASLVWSTTPALASLLKALPPSVLAPLITAAFTLPYPALSSFLSSLPPPPPAYSRPGPPPRDAPKYEVDETTLTSHLRSLLLAHSQETYDPLHPAAPLPPSISTVAPGSVASFPLRLSHTSSYLGLPTAGVDKRTALVGDAAHTVHPLAGQGLNMGLGDVRGLVEVLEQRTMEGADVGAYLSLLSYPRARYLPNHLLLSSCDHLHQLYCSSSFPLNSTNPLLVSARSVGVEVLNELGWVKDAVMRQAGSGGGGGGGGAGGGGKGGKGGGAWEGIAAVLEGAGKVREVVGMVGGAAVAAAGRRVQEFVVKGR